MFQDVQSVVYPPCRPRTLRHRVQEQMVLCATGENGSSPDPKGSLRHCRAVSWSSSVTSPTQRSGYPCRSGRVNILGLFHDELAVGQRQSHHRDSAEALEEKGHRPRAPSVVAEHELVEIGGKAPELHSALMGSEQPAPEEREGAVLSRKALGGLLGVTANRPRAVGPRDRRAEFGTCPLGSDREPHEQDTGVHRCGITPTAAPAAGWRSAGHHLA